MGKVTAALHPQNSQEYHLLGKSKSGLWVYLPVSDPPSQNRNGFLFSPPPFRANWEMKSRFEHKSVKQESGKKRPAAAAWGALVQGPGQETAARIRESPQMTPEGRTSRFGIGKGAERSHGYLSGAGA